MGEDQAETSRSGRGRLARETSDVAAEGLRGANKRKTSRRSKTSCEAAGRAKNQRFRETSAHEDGPRSASKRKTSGDQPAKQDQRRSCRTSQEPAVPRGKCARGRTEKCEQAQDQRRPPGEARPAAKLPDEPRTSGSAREARARADQSSAETSKEHIKGDGALWILQSKRFEHPFGGNCTAWHRARTPRDKRSGPQLGSLHRPAKDTHRVKKGVFETLTQGRGGVY